MRSFRVFEAASSAARLAAAATFLRQFPADHPITIVGATRGAADDFARSVASERGATLGLTRLSLTQLAARTAVLAMAADGKTPSSGLGAEAVAARAVFTALRDASLRYFEPVAGSPGFPRALARTLQELRLAGITADALHTPGAARADLADLLTRFDAAFADVAAADRAELLHTAARLLRDRPVRGAVLLLDTAVRDIADATLIRSLTTGAGDVLATVPRADGQSLTYLARLGAAVERGEDTGSGDLTSLRTYLFETELEPPHRTPDGSLELFSAPGEGRECVEISRRILKEARRGVRFDEMAIFVRSPQSYFGLLEHALGRAGVPAWFDRGTRRPHPAGRAFLALLACAAEHLSASRFAEYLSLGQVPQLDETTHQTWVASHDEALGLRPSLGIHANDEPSGGQDGADPDRAVVAGTLRAPWKWERVLMDAAVIGQAGRWKRRLDGRGRELAIQIEEARRQEGSDSGKVRALELTLEQGNHLRAFALPIIDEMAAWPARANWGEWLDRFESLVPRVLRMPAYVLRVLADLRPMAEVGPIDLDEVRRVLSDRLLMLDSDPPARRFGRIFVGTPDHARGRGFRVVFIPGLAERMFPQKPREDPLLLDERRAELDASLPTQDARLEAERLLLQIAVGAASERLYVSYPRIELSESRARVPSFYALDMMRAVTGSVPDHEWLEDRAREAGNAMLAWPAPSQPEDAIDDQEHDLSVLRRLLDEKDLKAVKGHAHYLLGLNECLRRSVIDRWAHGQHRWSANDGLIHGTPSTAPALIANRLTERSYSVSALQKFSACPYQFALSAFYRLEPLAQPEPLQRMDPLTRGSIFHDIQARFFRKLKAADALPVTDATIEAARDVLDQTIDEVAARQHDELAPAVERIWIDEMSSIRRDLVAWLHYLARDGADWEPIRFEFAFGRVPGLRDAASIQDDVVLEERFRLRGAIDLIESHRQTKVLRVTDHKTGRRPDRIERTIVGGGAVLQPVLYAMVVEKALSTPVSHGRLFYCTSSGSFYEHPIPLSDLTRSAGVDVLRIIDRAIEDGFLVAAPAEDACDRCDFIAVCGREVRRRIARKPADKLADLYALRSKP
ncbi:MAG TPA: PD-(D/E)XK nuclease family protein [Vicinamibacterales bacterium]|nr:PD-(D/E)XK nuclease family protein [Vicinamibacterales bacterium]